MSGFASPQAVLPRSGGHDVPPIVHRALRSAGQPLDHQTRTTVGAQFGHDFSQVRVHTDDRAAESAQAVRASAYTVGTSIVFNTGRYSPGTSAGWRLLAHELAHVVQQRGATGTGSLSLGSPGSLAETEASAAAAAVVGGHRVPNMTAQPDMTVARDESETTARTEGFIPRRSMHDLDLLDGRMLSLRLGPLPFTGLPLDPAFLALIRRDIARIGQPNIAPARPPDEPLAAPRVDPPGPAHKRATPPDPDPWLQGQVQVQGAVGIGTDATFVPISMALQLSSPGLYARRDWRSRHPIDHLSDPSLWQATNLIGEPALAIGVGVAVDAQAHELLSAGFNLIRLHFGQPKDSPNPDYDLSLGPNFGVDYNTKTRETGYSLQGQAQLAKTQGPFSVAIQVTGGVDLKKGTWSGTIGLVFGAQAPIVL